MSFVTFLMVLNAALWADDRFENLRDDTNVPAHCEHVQIEDFSEEIPRFYYGRAGTLEVGFTFESSVERADAGLLFNYFHSYVNGTPSLELYREIQESEDTAYFHDIILNNYEDMGITFKSEGEVLEVIATVELREYYPAPFYYITGGVTYRENHSSRTLGEIDVMIAESQDCNIVAVGEVKLGYEGALRKAYKQLERFSKFLEDQGMSALGGELEESQLPHCEEGVCADGITLPLYFGQNRSRFDRRQSSLHW